MADQEPALMPGIILSDLIIREAGSNKPSLIGCFQQFNFPQFPAKIGRFFVSVSITNLRGKLDALNATCRLEVAGTGHVVSSTSAQIQFAPESPPLDPRVGIDISLPFMNVQFPSAGTHTFVVLVDNEGGRSPKCRSVSNYSRSKPTKRKSSMSNPRFIVEKQSDEPEFTRVQCSDYVQVVLEDEPASAVSLGAGPIVLGKCFIFETKPTSRLGQE